MFSKHKEEKKIEPCTYNFKFKNKIEANEFHNSKCLLFYFTLLFGFQQKQLISAWKDSSNGMLENDWRELLSTPFELYLSQLLDFWSKSARSLSTDDKKNPHQSQCFQTQSVVNEAKIRFNVGNFLKSSTIFLRLNRPNFHCVCVRLVFCCFMMM